jgi:hypothetical protein
MEFRHLKPKWRYIGKGRPVTWPRVTLRPPRVSREPFPRVETDANSGLDESAKGAVRLCTEFDSLLPGFGTGW